MTRNVWLLCMLLILLIPGLAFSQKKADRELANAIDRHLLALGRQQKATTDPAYERVYLSQQFKALGTVPRGDGDAYTRTAVLDRGQRFEPGTALVINGHTLSLRQDFKPLSYSGTGNAEGSPLVAVQEPGEPWIMDLNNYFDTPPAPAELQDSLYRLARQAVADKATAVVFYQSKATIDEHSVFGTFSKEPLGIPVVYVTGSASSRYLNDPTASVHMQLGVDIRPDEDTIYAVMAGVDHGAPTTTILAAAAPEDEAMLIELARVLKDARKYGNANYLFVAFPGGKDEDSAIRYFSQHLPEGAGRPGCVLFLHDAAGSTLTIHGTGSGDWSPLLDHIRERTPLTQTDAAPDSMFEIPGVAALSFTGSGQSTPDPSGDVATIRYLSSVLENLNRRGVPAARGN